MQSQLCLCPVDGASAGAFDSQLYKCLAEVHGYDISLSSLVQGVIQVMSELDKLGLTTDPTPKPMLVVKKKIVLVEI